MKNILLSLFLVTIVCLKSFSQVQTITPGNALQGQTLTTTITMAAGAFSLGSPPFQNTDIYLQQGGTTIYNYAGYSWSNVYFPGDSLWTEFTIPTNAPNGYYDLNVTTYDWQGFPTVWSLPNGFFVGVAAGTVEGDIYFDANQNGVRDGGEIPLKNHKVSVNPAAYTVFTDAAGHYKAYLDTGSYSLSYLPNVSFFQTSSPATYNGFVPPSSTGKDFGVFSLQQYYNQNLYLWHNTMRCAPSYGYTYIEVTNNGVIPVQGSLTLTHSANVSFNNSVPPPDIINGNTITWNYTNLAVGQTLRIGGLNGANWISFIDPPAGQTVWYNVIDSVWDMSGNVMTQYADSFAAVTVCSFDPNDKWVSPPGTGNQNYTPPNTELTYTINFQNTGNDTAFTVIVTDSLDANLDWNTFEVISSTHPVFAQMDANGLVKFTFQNILLPDSNVDEPGSHGTVAYQIMTDSLLPDPVEINNTAYIYFDWNPPVITNTTKNTITALQYPSASFVTGDVSFCPGSCISFSNLTNGTASYVWSFPGGNPSSSTNTNPSNICYTLSGNYDVQLIATNALGSDTTLFVDYIEVYPVAPQAITQIGDTLFANPGFVNYAWFFNGNLIGGANNYYYVATQNGDYNVIAYDTNGCDVEAAAINVLTRVNQPDKSNAILIYPNPVRDLMEIKGANGGEITICNVLGERIIYAQPLSQNSSDLSIIDISTLPAGVYSVELKTADKTFRSKIIKQ